MVSTITEAIITKAIAVRSTTAIKFRIAVADGTAHIQTAAPGRGELR